MAETIKPTENQEEESQEQNQVDFVVDPLSEEDLEDVSGGCGICIDGSSQT